MPPIRRRTAIVTNVDNTLNLGSPAYNQAGTFTQAAIPAARPTRTH